MEQVSSLERMMIKMDKDTIFTFFIIFILLIIEQLFKINVRWTFILLIIATVTFIVFYLFYHFMECSFLNIPLKIIISFIICKLVIHYIINYAIILYNK